MDGTMYLVYFLSHVTVFNFIITVVFTLSVSERIPSKPTPKANYIEHYPSVLSCSGMEGMGSHPQLFLLHCVWYSLPGSLLSSLNCSCLLRGTPSLLYSMYGILGSKFWIFGPTQTLYRWSCCGS